jgi:hypothetical protein
MACFIVTATEAVVTTVATKIIEKKGNSSESAQVVSKISKKLNLLNNMLWGGSALLALEHVWHGEVVPWFPFLTNAANPADRAEMLHEMATSGVAMALLVTLVWAGIVAVSVNLEKQANIKSNCEVSL